MPREATIVRSILRWLNSLPNCVARKLHGSPYAVAGDPDIYGCIKGHMFVIEVKQPNQQARPLQMRRLGEWLDAGAITMVAHSLDEARELLAPYVEMEFSI